MKLLSTLYKLENVEEMLTYADGLVVGIKGLSSRETSYLSLKEVKELLVLVKKQNKELYLSLKPFLHHQEEALLSFLKELKGEPVNIIVGDIGYYSLLKPLNFNIIYNPESLLTNTHDVNLLKTYGIGGAFIAKEIDLQAIQTIINQKELPLYMVGHGYLNMFYSRRKLLKSYFETLALNHEYHHEKMRIKEENRDNFHPIIEDDFGTHVYRGEVSSVIDYLEQLEGLDYLLIDGIFHDDHYVIDVLKMFRGLHSKELLLDKYEEVWDDGFLFKKTIYKG